MNIIVFTLSYMHYCVYPYSQSNLLSSQWNSAENIIQRIIYHCLVCSQLELQAFKTFLPPSQAGHQSPFEFALPQSAGRRLMHEIY